MRKSIRCVLLLGVVGCGHSDPVSKDAPLAAPSGTAATPNSTSESQRLTPEQAIALARDLIQKQNLNGALQLLNQAIKANPVLTEALVMRSSLFSDAKRYTLAIRDMNVLIQLQPENAQFHNTRGYFSLLIENNGPAMDDFNKAIALDPNYAQPLNNRGLVRISLGGQFKQAGDPDKAAIEFRKAVNELDAALRIDDKYVDAHNNRGFALSLAHKYDEAILSFTRAIELDSKYVNAWNNRGQAQARAGRYDLAIADFTQAIELQPTSLEYYQLRADAYKAAGQTELAHQDHAHLEWCNTLEALNRQLNADPKNPSHWVARGDQLRKVARWDEANQNYEDALRLDANCQSALVGRAHVLLHLGQLDAALMACQKTLELGPNRDATSLRGDILNQQGKYDEAIGDYQVAQRFDSQVAQAYLKRGEQRKAGGDIQQASADILMAVQMDPNLRTSVPDAPAEEVPAVVAPGAFPVDDVEAEPLEPVAATPVVPAAVEPAVAEPAVAEPAAVEPVAPAAP